MSAVFSILGLVLQLISMFFSLKYLVGIFRNKRMDVGHR